MEEQHIFTVFYADHPQLAGGILDFALTRAGDNNPNHFEVALAKGYGFLYDRSARRYSELNYSTPPGRAGIPELSEHGFPLIWFDARLDRQVGVPEDSPSGMLAALLKADPPVIRLTGRTKKMHCSGVYAGAREASEVEVLLKEDDLARICSYCGVLEWKGDVGRRHKRHTGEGYQSLYWCEECEKSRKRRWELLVRGWFGAK